MDTAKTRNKIFIGCGAFSALAVLLLGGLLAWQWRNIQPIVDLTRAIFADPEFAQLDTVEAFEAYLDAHADNVAIVSYSVAPDGTPMMDETAVFHNADEPMPLASTVKIVILAAYTQAVVEGTVDPETAVSLATWDSYHIPARNGGAHISALEDLGIETDEHGYALDPTQTVTHDQMAYAMIRFSDNAAPDYFIELLGQEALAAVQMAAGETAVSPILPHGGFVLSQQTPEQPRLTQTHLDNLLAMSDEVYAAFVLEQQKRFIATAWGDEVRDWLRGDVPTNPLALEETAVNQLANKGSARVYANIVGGVATETFISPEVSRQMKAYLDWPMDFTSNQPDFLELGAKGGSFLTVLTGATYAVPRNDSFAEQPRVVVLFMREIPVAAWLALTGQFTHQNYERQLLLDQQYATQQAEKWSNR